MRIGIGIIDEIKENGMAKIQVSDESLYVACSACSAIGHVYVTAHNPIGAQEGDKVRYEVEDKNLISGALVCFIVPLLTLFLGGLIGVMLGSGSYLSGGLGAFVGFAAALPFLKRYDNIISPHTQEPRILSLVLEEEEED